MASTSPPYGKKEGKDGRIPDSEIEWRTEGTGSRRGSHVIVGLLVRLLESDGRGRDVFVQGELAKTEDTIRRSISVFNLLQNYAERDDKLAAAVLKILTRKFDSNPANMMAESGAVEGIVTFL